MKKRFAIAFSVSAWLFLIAACQQTVTIKDDDVYGVWVQEGGFPFFLLDEDSTYYYAGDNSRNNPWQFGIFRIDGTKMVIVGDKDSPECANYSMTWEIEVVDQDNLIFTPVEIECPEWKDVSGDFLFTRYNP